MAPPSSYSESKNMTTKGKRKGALALTMSVFAVFAIAGMNFTSNDLYHRMVALLLVAGGGGVLAGLLMAKRNVNTKRFDPNMIIISGISVVVGGSLLLMVHGIA